MQIALKRSQRLSEVCKHGLSGTLTNDVYSLPITAEALQGWFLPQLFLFHKQGDHVTEARSSPVTPRNVSALL